MRFNGIRPMLYTKQMDASIQFYTDVLGFTCLEHNTEWGWACLQKDAIEIMLAIPNEHIPFDKPLFTGSLYIDVLNVDECWEQLKDKVHICYPIENFEWGMREFAFYDNNVYLIQMGQAV